jgi:DNA-binding NarL/FixJ family response regulator
MNLQKIPDGLSSNDPGDSGQTGDCTSAHRTAFVQRRVLIIDDNAYVRQSIRWTIERDLEWQVCGEAANGAEGVSAAAEMKPDVIVLDLSMPVMNGIEAARQLKRLMPKTHLLMFTSFVTPTLEEAARDVGIEAFVAKSDGAVMLLQSLRRIVSPAQSPTAT